MRNKVQPYRNPRVGENDSRRYTYCPPACGIMAASSPYDSAAVIVSTPAIIQESSSQPELPSCRDISADTMKIAEPIIPPATIMVLSNRPSPRLKPRSLALIAWRSAGALGSDDVTFLLRASARPKSSRRSNTSLPSRVRIVPMIGHCCRQSLVYLGSACRNVQRAHRFALLL